MRQRTGCSADPVAVGALSGHDRYDLVIYLLFLGGRGKEKFWVQILHHLSNFGVVIYNTGCGRKPQNQCSIRLLGPIENGKSFILFLISNELVSPGAEVCKRYANLFAHQQRTADVETRSTYAQDESGGRYYWLRRSTRAKAL